MPSDQGAAEPALPDRQHRPLGGDAEGGAGGLIAARGVSL
jgi:hypothetical protein